MKDFKPKDVKAVQLFREDIIYAANKIFNQNIPWWQRLWLKGILKASISYIIAARGSGKTRTIALFCLLRSLLFPKEKVGIMSNSYRQAQMIFTEVCNILDCSPHAKASIKQGPTVGLQKCFLKFQNGSVIEALPLGDGSKIRSARFHTMVVDEFQDIDQHIIDVVVLPFLNVQKNPVNGMLVATSKKENKESKNRLVITSTARYKYNPAYDKYALIRKMHEEGHPDYFHSCINIDDLRTIPGWVNENTVQLQEQTMSPVEFRMENYGIWADTGNGFFDPLACDNMRDIDTNFLDGPRDGCQYVLGVDPAKSSTNFSMVMLEWDGTTTRLCYANAFQKDDVALAMDMMKYLHHKFNKCLIYMDARGGGIWVSDEIMKTSVGSLVGEVGVLDGISPEKITMVQTAHPLIDNMNWALKAGIENGRIKVPNVVESVFLEENDIVLSDKKTQEVNELIKELQSIVQKQLEKEVQYTTESKHALKDRYCAFMYAYWGVVENWIAECFTEDDTIVFTV